MSGIKTTADDRRFSLMVRERDNWTCQRCGARKVDESGEPIRGPQLHCAHYFSRGVPTTRMDPDNALALCYGCHEHLSRHRDEFTRLMVKRLGRKRHAALVRRAKGARDRKTA